MEKSIYYNKDNKKMDFLNRYSIMKKNNNFYKNMYKKIGLTTLGAFLFINSVFTGNVFAGTDTVINVNDDLEITITRSIGEETETYEVQANDNLKSLNFTFSETAFLEMSKNLDDSWKGRVIYNELDISSDSASSATIIDFIEDKIPDLTLKIEENSKGTLANIEISKTVSDNFFNKILVNHDPFAFSATSLKGKDMRVARSRTSEEKDAYEFSSTQELSSASIKEGADNLHIARNKDDSFHIWGQYDGRSEDKTFTASRIFELALKFGDLDVGLIGDEYSIIITPDQAIVDKIAQKLLDEKKKITQVTIPASGNIDISDYPNAKDVEIPSDASNPSITFAPSGNQAQTSNTLTINAQNAGMQFEIPQGTIITGPSGWSGEMMLPTIISATAQPETQSGWTKTIDLTIKIGLADKKITFDKPVKLVFPGMAGKSVGFVSGGELKEITSICNSQTSPTLPDSECKTTSGSDLLVFTNHFTEFSVFTKSQITSGGGGTISYFLNVSNVNVNNQSSSAVITFNASESASAIVKYGTSQGNYTSEVKETQLKTSHSLTLNNLVNGTYYYKIEIDNGEGSKAEKLGSFTIGTQPQPNEAQDEDEMETFTKVKEQKTYNYNGIITKKPLNEMNRNELYRLFLMLLLKSLLAQRGITL